MCGICGTVGFVDPALLESMTDIIAHRGPDDAGVFVSPEARVGFGNCRLSIIDLSPAGHMPMTNAEGTLCITYNGEIYNFPQLRAELEQLGYSFASHSDTEVILHGYAAWGLDVLKRLNGMFAFALLDRRAAAPVVLLARDRFGIKPLYYTIQGQRLLFGSEIKSILVSPDVPRRMNARALHRYLAFGWVTGPETMFEGISKLMPAEYMLWQDSRATRQTYWNMEFSPDSRATEKELIHELQAVLTRAVERHLLSDVPLGVFLSGGLDSSAILALMTQITRAPVTAYTIAYRPEDGRLEQSMDDAAYARLVAGEFHADYNEIVAAPDMVELLPKLTWHMDEPVADPAAIATYLISQAARPRLKVLLSGQGGDELFAGYRVHRNHMFAEWMRFIPSALRDGPARGAVGLLPALKDRIPGVHPGLVMAAHRYTSKLLDGAALSPEERYIFYRSYYTDAQQLEFYAPALREQLGGYHAGERHLEYFHEAGGDDFLNRVLYVDAKTFLPELNLTYSDKMSSAASVEARTPFLDVELVEFMTRVPPALKLKGVTGKYILKKAMEGILPRSVIYRRKAGFGAPIRAWLRGDLRPLVDDCLSPEFLHARGLFEPAQVRALVEQDRAGVEDNSYRVWALLCLELWQRTFLDG